MMKRTNVRREETLTGAWLVRLHALLESDSVAKTMLVAESPLKVHAEGCTDIAVAFTPDMLSLEELVDIRLLKPVDHLALGHRLARHYYQGLDPALVGAAPAVLQMLLAPGISNSVLENANHVVCGALPARLQSDGILE